MVDWGNDLITSGLVILWEVVGLLPLLTWFILREIRRQLPSLMTALANDPQFVQALKMMASKFGMSAGKMTMGNALGMGMNMILPMILQRIMGGAGGGAPPAAPPPG